MNKSKLPISDKTSVREESKRRISQMNSGEKIQETQKISERLRSFPRIQTATNIILYDALDDEVSLQDFIVWAHGEKKSLYMIDPMGNFPSLPSDGVILVPGRAFTLSGKRIGRGGGWYDRFLQEHPQFFSIGICFYCQIFEDIPQDEWDQEIDNVISLQKIKPVLPQMIYPVL